MLLQPVHKILVLLFIGIFSGCSSSIQIDGFDTTIWQGDKQGCNGLRKTYLEVLSKSQDLLLERSQNDLEEIFGLPDSHELDKRRQKFFFYYLEPGPECSSAVKNPIQLQIRFNAVGLSSEVFFLNN